MDEEYLRNAVASGASFHQIARDNKKSVTAVRYWAKKYGIKPEKFSRLGWNKKDLLVAVESSKSKREILAKLGIRDTGSSYSSLNKFAEIFDVKLPENYTNGKYNRGPRRSVAEMFSRESGCSTSTLKRYLISEFNVKYECSACGLKNWMNNDITLHIDHVDGDRSNNLVDNLRLLCPNCHSQTSTYCRK